MQKITSCLWFNNQAEEAAKFYTSIFRNSSVGKTARYTDASAQASGQSSGSVMTIEYEIEGVKILGLNGGPMFSFTPAMSFFVWRKTEAEVDELWQQLSFGGKARMELGQYHWSKKYGWTTDRFGVDWQIMLSDERQEIAPCMLFVNSNFGKGSEAIEFYTSLFKGSKIEQLNQDDRTKMVLHCVFSIGNQRIVLMEGHGEHAFAFSHAFSLMITCHDQDEIDYFWNKLTNQGSSEPCGWLKDRYGVSWQIVPENLAKFMGDPVKSEVVMRELLKMKKPELAKLIDAYNRA